MENPDLGPELLDQNMQLVKMSRRSVSTRARGVLLDPVWLTRPGSRARGKARARGGHWEPHTDAPQLIWASREDLPQTSSSPFCPTNLFLRI